MPETAKSPRAASVLLTACLAVGCGGDAEDPPARRALPEPRPAPTSGVTPARYATDVAFVGLQDRGTRLYYRFHHVVSPSQLHRRYRIWGLRPDGWHELFAHRDSLPLPRAGWRVLPAASLRLTVEEGGELATLVHGDSSARVELHVDSIVARWTGPTGQYERLRLARVETSAGRQQGLVMERRKARAEDAPRPPGRDRFVLLSDGAGNGLLVLQTLAARGEEADVTSPETGASLYSWYEGDSRSWQARSQSGEGERRSWELRSLDGAVDVQFELSEPLASPARADSLRIYRVAGTFRYRGDTRSMRGLAVESAGP